MTTRSITSRGFMVAHLIGGGETHSKLTDAKRNPRAKGRALGAGLNTCSFPRVPLNRTGSDACVHEIQCQPTQRTEGAS